jgi:hypothetical protein
MQSGSKTFHRRRCTGAGLASVLLAIPSGLAMAKDEKGPRIEPPQFDRTKFERSTIVDNKYHPLVPGTRHTYKGSVQEGGERVPHKVVWTVTDLTKVVDGVRAVVVHEQDHQAGKLIESELVFFAQDNAGTFGTSDNFARPTTRRSSWVAGRGSGARTVRRRAS